MNPNGRFPHPSERIPFAVPPDPIERVAEPAPPKGWFPAGAPIWFRVGYVSLAVFAGPALLAAVVGLVAVLSVAVTGVLDIVRRGAGI